MVGAHRLAERLGPDAVIVTLAVDSGFKYLSVSPYADTTAAAQSSSAISAAALAAPSVSTGR